MSRRCFCPLLQLIVSQIRARLDTSSRILDVEIPERVCNGNIMDDRAWFCRIRIPWRSSRGNFTLIQRLVVQGAKLWSVQLFCSREDVVEMLGSLKDQNYSQYRSGSGGQQLGIPDEKLIVPRMGERVWRGGQGE